jgi:hypothetical protein
MAAVQPEPWLWALITNNKKPHTMETSKYRTPTLLVTQLFNGSPGVYLFTLSVLHWYFVILQRIY